MNKLQKGFTLLELMIVVAIIGILAAIAIPSYKDYTIKTKVSQAIANLAPQKVKVAQSYNDGVAVPGVCADAMTAAQITATGCDDASTAGEVSFEAPDSGVTPAVTVKLTGTVPVNAGDDWTWACAAYDYGTTTPVTTDVSKICH